MASVVRILLASFALLGATAAQSETYVWVDEHGMPHITDDPAAVPPGSESRTPLSDVFDEGLLAPPETSPVPGSGSGAEERTRRLLAGAVDDLRRGENARATIALESVLRSEPARPEAHWYLALLDTGRGRYLAAEAHLRTFLANAGDNFAEWRASAERRLAAIEDETRLADLRAARGPLRLVSGTSEHFRIRYDAELDDASPDYARTVLRFLDEARAAVGQQLGTVPREPLGVVFYGKAAYLREYRHRFSFQTVGFFDGRIHVVSAAHPSGELRALLFHEYTHAVFREQTGGDRPYWLNEGLAEITERGARQHPPLTRSERSALRKRIDDGRWIPLRRLAPSFSGLDDDDARTAYLEATAAAAWLDARTDSAARARLVHRLSEGVSDDDALREAVGVDTAGLDEALRREIQSEFGDPRRSAPASGVVTIESRAARDR